MNAQLQALLRSGAKLRVGRATFKHVLSSAPQKPKGPLAGRRIPGTCRIVVCDETWILP